MLTHFPMPSSFSINTFSTFFYYNWSCLLLESTTSFVALLSKTFQYFPVSQWPGRDLHHLISPMSLSNHCQIYLLAVRISLFFSLLMSQTCWLFSPYSWEPLAPWFRLSFDYVFWHNFRWFHTQMGNHSNSLSSQFFDSFTFTDLHPYTVLATPYNNPSSRPALC